MSLCCSNPATEPNYTICFPDQQVIPGGMLEANPFYDFNSRVSYWTYTIEIDSGGSEIKDLSNWVLQICPELSVDDLKVEISQDGQTFIPITDIEVLGVDPPSGVRNVLKINRAQLKGTTLIYRISIIDNNLFDLAGESGTIGIKAGTGIFLFNENSCLHSLPTPSLDCIKVHRPHQNLPPIPTLTKRCPKHDTVIYSVGDTININLEVTNPGSVPITDVSVLDLLNIPPGVTIGAVATDPPAIITPLQPTYTNEDILFTWNSLTIPPGVTSLAINFTILAAPVDISFITNVDAGIGDLSGTDQFTCIIAVYQEVENVMLDCELQLCLLFKSRSLVNLLVPSYGYCIPSPCINKLSFPKILENQGQAEEKESSSISQCCPLPDRIECLFLEKIYDSCFQKEEVSRSTTVPFPNLIPGEMINCQIHDFIMCEIIEEQDLGGGIKVFTLRIYLTLILQDPDHGEVSVIRVVTVKKSVTLCAPEGTIIDCTDSQPLSCLCMVT